MQELGRLLNAYIRDHVKAGSKMDEQSNYVRNQIAQMERRTMGQCPWCSLPYEDEIHDNCPPTPPGYNRSKDRPSVQ
jgi:hypothetical protein